MFDHTLDFCRNLPSVSTERKWDDELRFYVGEKLFCMLSMNPPHRISFKCAQDKFHQLISQPDIVPAPHLARYHWVQVKQDDTLPENQLHQLLQKAYEITVNTLPPFEQEKILNSRVHA
ncbi:Predicted DNA-binding protein, MmcQ/YjbR family [Chitinophaga terrae (ex Kim and Jung 2007)]|jgi:predicted DNA-binding protein (MmcQ/YjbR family)|uniref:Predicted DNA-binding protein, MmcQ/YjbR family n=1 Tax=Chitinophaga terrae (ex Kim and Jung 2007) TaxID=408074 RepID=A0A1H4FE88_9BACT|nr:MmcQ/YjbR family DNA-binding protein [Chitinophaga terrae (ex Kim and Jung 2007)]MDQ0110308.1 putative DNA-binding protein (MmcQ/YjbR family) [Chitinophaga terrae (ex Kim and Jung 2007)]GEP92431.1 hypothetical protein CTE07_40760 [Chitinophaga terrae (ex Kim and Jung 2007)]SEA95150.1 Predicted DNA-binding protein, MmcQ/YjbR family [Chitinophaga terrae (ex Kim and Jung 2007)]